MMLNEQELDWYNVSKDEPIRSSKFKYKLVKINGNISHSLRRHTEIFKLDHYLGAFGSYIFFDSPIDDKLDYVNEIWELPALYIGLTAGEWWVDVKNKKTSNHRLKSALNSRLIQHKNTYILSESGPRYDDIWVSLAVPVEMGDYGRDKKHWARLMEGHMQYYYRKFHGTDPKYSKEFGQRVNHESRSQELTREKRRTPNLTKWEHGSRMDVGV